VRGRTPSRPGEERVWIGGWYPVRHRLDGSVLGLGAFVVEVTDRVRLLEAERRARERAAFLARAGELLSESLDEGEVLQRVARISVPEKADWCAVDLATADGRLQRLVVAHADPGRERAAVDVERRWPVGAMRSPGARAVLRTGEALLVPRVTDAYLRSVAVDDEQLRALRRFGITSLIIAPVTVGGRTIGTLTFAQAESGRTFGDDDLALALDVARRAGAALDNARLYRERDHIAATLQRSLLPPRLPDLPGFEIAGATARPGRPTTSAATSTTSSPPARTRGSSPSATSAARGRRPPR
jgi:GAF domain-containing protein